MLAQNVAQVVVREDLTLIKNFVEIGRTRRF